MKKKIAIILSLIIILSILSSALVSCQKDVEHLNAKSITFSNMSEEEISYNHLEKSGDNKMSFVKDGTSDFSIYVDKGAKASLLNAAKELQAVVLAMSGAKIEIKNVLEDKKGIILGDLATVSIKDVENDGFVTNIEDNKIEIKGKNDDGSRNGVYSFMEDYLGVIFYRYDDSFIPSHRDIYLEKTCKVNNPRTAWRDVYCLEGYRNTWCAKLKLNGYNVEKTDEELGVPKENKEAFYKNLERSMQYSEWGTWCHSYFSYLSPDEYYETHPEYFSLLNGKRTIKAGGRDGQLCLSNPEVYKIVESNLLKKIKENPDVKYWDFSCNDSPNIPGCQCKECKALDKAAGGTGMGSLLPFINKLAKKVKEVYPDKEIYISTLAYLHTVKPPTNDIQLEDNVVIKLCSMPGDQGTSYLNPGNKNAADFNSFLKEWSKIAKHIVIWDYVVDFANLVMPFPNFAVQQENQKFYEENNVQGIFHQASREAAGELVMLRTYILSKLMWEGSSLDVGKEVSKFVAAYYGNAAPKVIEYLNLMHKNLSESSSNLGLYDSLAAHCKGYLSKENIISYEKIILEAKDLVKDDAKLLSRVEDIELNVQFAKMHIPDLSKEQRKETKDIVIKLCKDQNITMTREWESFDDYYNNTLDKEINNIKVQLNLPTYISLGVIGGILLIVGILIGIIFIKRKLKKQ